MITVCPVDSKIRKINQSNPAWPWSSSYWSFDTTSNKTTSTPLHLPNSTWLLILHHSKVRIHPLPQIPTWSSTAFEWVGSSFGHPESFHPIAAVRCHLRRHHRRLHFLLRHSDTEMEEFHRANGWARARRARRRRRSSGIPANHRRFPATSANPAKAWNWGRHLRRSWRRRRDCDTGSWTRRKRHRFRRDSIWMDWIEDGGMGQRRHHYKVLVIIPDGNENLFSGSHEGRRFLVANEATLCNIWIVKIIIFRNTAEPAFSCIVFNKYLAMLELNLVPFVISSLFYLSYNRLIL